MRSAFKWFGIVAGVFIGSILLGTFTLYGRGQTRLNKRYDVPLPNVTLPVEANSIEEGKRIFQYRGCEACHGGQLQGVVYLDNPALGKVITPNLTQGRGGIGLQRTEAELARAIRHGIRPDGTPLLFMPSTEFYYLSEADLARVLAYIRSALPVDNEMPPSELSFTGFVAMNITQAITFLPAELIPHAEAPPPAPPPAVTAEYGKYLSLSCMVCHGVTLSGGAVPGFPPGWRAPPNLTPGSSSRLPSWGEEGFITIMRNGEKHGRRIDATYMPWESYRHMNDDELRAVYTFLMSLPPKDFGNR